MASKFTADKIAEMLAQARAKLAANVSSVGASAQLDTAITEVGRRAVEASDAELARYIEDLKVQRGKGIIVDLSKTGISLDHPEAIDQLYAFFQDISRKHEEEKAAAYQPEKILGVARDDITYNDKQQDFIDRGSAGQDLVLLGAAGTGKTTCQRGLGKRLILDKKILPLKASTKWLRAGVPGIAVLSFTNKAVNNIRHALPDVLKVHALTVHKILEFAPIFYEIPDEENPGQMRKTMRFEPTRNKFNPLPGGLKLIIMEEGSMVSAELDEMVSDACPHNPQRIYLGDIQQLPPVFGSAILGFKMLELHVIELTEVYRQALNSPIISLAWDILSGDPKRFDSRAIPNPENPKRKIWPVLQALSRSNEDGTVLFQPWQKPLSADLALITCTKQFNVWADQGYYNPDDDILLCPFNVSFGTIELNKGISQHLGRKRGAVIHEVIAGFEKYYLAIGDRVLYEKEDAFILAIARNDEYLGKAPQPPSKYLDRWGHLRSEDMDEGAQNEYQSSQTSADDFDLAAIDKFMAAAASDSEERVAAASHSITLRIPATGEEVEVDTAAGINGMLGGYAITVHKSQGSEWEKVFIVMHNSHATMNQRELLYTAVTRARKYLHVICEPNTFERGVVSQKIKGNTLAEKAEIFKGKMEEREKLKIEKMKNDPIKIAFALVPEWDSLAREAVDHWWKLAQQRWPVELGTKPAPAMNWRIYGSAAGLADLKSREVFLSPIYLHLDPNQAIADTIPHEVAHIVAKDVYNERGHGFGWQQAMLFFKRDPKAEQTHSLGKLPAALQQIMAESLKAQEENPDTEV